MKKFYAMLFAALVMALSFSQCSKDKDSDDDDDRKASSSSSSSVSESDLTGTWVISEAKYGTYDMSEYLRNETWSFNNGSFRGAFYGDDYYYNCNYTYKNGKLTISGGDLYEEDDDDYWEEEKFEFSSIKIEGTILTLSGNIIQTVSYGGETYNDRESCYFRLEKQGGNGGNSDVSDILGTWYVDYCAVDGDDYTDSEGYRNKTWTFYNNGNVSGYFGWDFDCNYSYRNGILTLSGGDFYESEYGYTEEIIMKFTNVQRNDDILTLSGNVTYRIVEDGETDNETSSIYIRLSKNASLPLPTEGSFQWVRQGGGAATGLDEFGLYWNRNNNKAYFAYIQPLDGSRLYILSASDYYATSLSSIYFPTESDLYKNVSVDANGTYNDVIATVYNGKTYLINVTRCSVVSDSYGTKFTITGSYKRFDYTR